MKALYVGLLVAFLFGLPVYAAEPSAEESKLVALENAWNQAQLYKDVKALDELTVEQFVYTDTDGTVMNKIAFLADAKDRSYRATFAANDEIAVHLYDDTAVVLGRYHTKGTYKGKPFDHKGRFTDMWIQRNGKWQCVASHTSLLGK